MFKGAWCELAHHVRQRLARRGEAQDPGRIGVTGHSDPAAQGVQIDPFCALVERMTGTPDRRAERRFPTACSGNVW